ncbi:hypothetical protein [Actinomyces trachealis]|uniref:hypothetical protein n=1 Tax=Actinomyces trachealis TaxID=2763540 RepID=UPI0018928B0A|nr:hypothetical protein [Actinomyces trachealis]
MMFIMEHLLNISKHYFADNKPLLNMFGGAFAHIGHLSAASAVRMSVFGYL